MAHTPGPWRVVTDSVNLTWNRVVTDAGRNVACPVEDRDDARLMAAAPRLLAACKTALREILPVNSLFYRDPEWACVTELREAIAEAEPRGPDDGAS